MKAKKYIAEAIGTFALTGAVALSLAGVFPVSTPVIAALVLGLFVYSIGHVSGTHINPAVTIGAWSIGKIKTPDAFAYIVSQFIGAVVALILVNSVTTPAEATMINSLPVFLAEALGMAFFTFGIASVVYGKTPAVMSGFVVGGSLLLGITFAALLGSDGILNPAVALGVGSLNLVYALGPIIGSIVGMQTYRLLATD